MNTKKIVAALSALSLTLGMMPAFAVSAEEAEQPLWTVREGHRYQVFDESLSWTEARIRCSLMGGHLVSISDAEEQAFVQELISSYSKDSYWIGLHTLEGGWKWEDGSEYVFQNWDLDLVSDTQKPDNFNGNEYFGKLYAKSAEYENWSCNAGKWDDAADEADEGYPLSNYGFICEWDTVNAKKAEGTAQGILVFGTHVYQLIDSEGISWETAEELCEENGAHLATITSAEEQAAVESLLTDAGTSVAYWLGASDSEEEGEWEWVTEEVFDYTNWSRQGPNDSTQFVTEGEDYLGIVMTETSWAKPMDWNDFAGESTAVNGYICEWDCQPASYAYNGHIYKTFNVGLEWDDARVLCEMLGGHLITVADEDEQLFMESMFGENMRNSYWMGAKVRQQDVFWVTGEVTEYRNWASRQPDNAYGIGEDSLMVYINRNPFSSNLKGQWNDLRADGTCQNEAFFGVEDFGLICEWDSSADVPEEYLQTVYLRGDANTDGKVSIADAVLIARVVAEDKQAVITDTGKSNADLDDDDILTSNDLELLLKLLAGIK